MKSSLRNRLASHYLFHGRFTPFSTMQLWDSSRLERAHPFPDLLHLEYTETSDLWWWVFKKRIIMILQFIQTVLIVGMKTSVSCTSTMLDTFHFLDFYISNLIDFSGFLGSLCLNPLHIKAWYSTTCEMQFVFGVSLYIYTFLLGGIFFVFLDKNLGRHPGEINKAKEWFKSQSLSLDIRKF